MLVRAAATVLLSLLLGVGGSVPVLAHALLESSDPATGGAVSTAPTVVTLTFSEEPDVGLSSVDVFDTAGTNVTTGPAASPPGEARVLRVPVGPLDRGVYTVSWKVVSQVDGHLTGGAFAFGVGVSADEVVATDVPEVEAPPLSPWEVGGRFGLYVGLGLLVGVGWTAAAAFGRPGAGQLRLALAGSVVAASGLVCLAVAQRLAAGVGFGRLMGSPIGKALAGRGLGILVATLALVWLWRRRERAPAVVVGVGAAAALFVHTGAGHAATGSLAGAKVVSQWVHTVAFGVWIGGLAALLVGLRGTAPGDRPLAVRRFSRLAGYALAAIVATGTMRAWNEVGSFGALVGTSYGRVVLLKVAGLGVLALLAAVNRFRHVPRDEAGVRGVLRVGRAELVVASGVLVATALLASLVPSRSVVAESEERTAIVVEAQDFARSVSARIEIAPGFPGPNEIDVVLTDRDGEPLDAERVALRAAPDGEADVQTTTIELEEAQEGRWTATAPLAVGGLWEADLLVQRGAASVEVPVRFATRCRSESFSTEGQPTLHDIELAAGRTVQAYADPGEPGANEIHFTFFDEGGEELPITGSLTMSALPLGVDLDEMEPVDLAVRRFTPGHYVGSGEFEEGRWRFDVTAVQEDGERLSACFEETLG